MESFHFLDPATWQPREHDAGLLIQFSQILEVRRVFRLKRRPQLPNQLLVNDVLGIQLAKLTGDLARLAFELPVLRDDLKSVDLRAKAAGSGLR